MTDKTAQFRERVNRLKMELNAAQRDASTEKCLPMMLIAAALTPIATFLGLYFISPGFVQEESPAGNKTERSTKKVFIWTLGISLICWALMYAWSYCQSYNGASLCARS